MKTSEERIEALETQLAELDNRTKSWTYMASAFIVGVAVVFGLTVWNWPISVARSFTAAERAHVKAEEAEAYADAAKAHKDESQRHLNALEHRKIAWGEWQYNWKPGAKPVLREPMRVNFKFPDGMFQEPPIVMTTVYHFDQVPEDTHMRMIAIPDDDSITNEGFTLIANGSDPGLIYHHWVRWFAIPAPLATKVYETPTS